MNCARIHIGVAGWSYPDWQGIVYPRGATAARLRRIATIVDCVEINSSFYRPPTAATTANWLRTTESHSEFRFLAKAWQRFTHHRTTRWTAAEFELFTHGLAPLRDAGRLDVLLFQFPWSFRNTAANRDWLARIAAAFAGWPNAVEVRHDSWSSAEMREWWRAQRFTFCNIDQPALAHCLEPTAFATTATALFRFHGRNATNWFKEETEYGARYDYLYSAAELSKLRHRVRRLPEQAARIFIIFNNHKNGKAVANAVQLKAELVPGPPPRLPRTLLEAYPALCAIARPEGPEQLSLV